MKRVLVVGVDTAVGGNLAVTLADHYRVVGFSANEGVRIAGIDVRFGIPQSQEEIRRELAVLTPDLVVVCGPASQASWSLGETQTIEVGDLKTTVLWARCVAEMEARLMVISSDAVFHGPWMFHEENCSGVCQSATARAIREMEAQVAQCCPTALIVRTNAIGWSPLPDNGWLETLLEHMAHGKSLQVPAANYATPIAAGALANLLIRAWDRKLEGIYHVGGSERVNFVHFAHRLAQEFQLPRPKFVSTRQPEGNHVFGQGETSLNSGRFRRSVGTPLPMLGESLKQLRQQSEDGQLDRLHAEEAQFASYAA